MAESSNALAFYDQLSETKLGHQSSYAVGSWRTSKAFGDLDAWISLLRKGEVLAPHACRFICTKLVEVLLGESNIHTITAPVTVVGDLHGQFYDVLEMFRVGGEPPLVNYLFLGDYVDRGHFSLQTISMLACLKLRYPDRVTLIRGNHESRQTTLTYGFYAECMREYGNKEVWQWFTDMFDFLPLAALIPGPTGAIFATHGGLSPSMHTLDHIRVIDRFGEIPTEGPMCDLMWGDPEKDQEGFKSSPRGAGYTFGRDVVDKFMELNRLTYFVRAHQLCQEGYLVLWDKFATVWSAPNYCYRMGNKASICEISENHEKYFNVFDPAPADERKVPAKEKKTFPTFFTNSTLVSPRVTDQSQPLLNVAAPTTLQKSLTD